MKNSRINKNCRKPLIIILEDDADFREVVIKLFLEFDLDAIGAGTIKEANEIYNKYSSSILFFIIDIWIPNGNGLEFLKKIRLRGNNSPAIIMSSIITEDVIKIGEKIGNVKYMEKPINLRELLNEFRKIKV